MPAGRTLVALALWLALAGLAPGQNEEKKVDPPPPPPREELKLEIKVGEPVVPEGKAGKAPAETDPAEDDRATLRGVGITADGPALLDYLRKRTFPEPNPKDLDRLVGELGDDAYAVREAAFDRLAGLGAAAIAGLKKGEADPSPEIRLRVAELKRRIDAKAEPAVQAAAIRLIARAKPAGGAAVLLGYLPFAPDQGVVDEVCRALGAVAAPGGRVDPVVTQALTDAVPLKRAAAGEALARADVKDQQPAVRKLLKDADPAVRLRVALALLPTKEKDVQKELLTTLVDVVGELPPEQLWPAEEVLVRLAGPDAPAVSLGTDEKSRAAARDAWRGWLAKNGAAVDLAKLQEPETLLGRTLYVQQAINNFNPGLRRPGSEVVEVDARGQVKWKFAVATNPVDPQVVGPDRVLIAEYQGGQVSERDFKGAVKWSARVNGNPIGVQRLPNGNTFVVTQNRLLEINRKGDEVFSLPRVQHDVMRARKLRTGDVVMISNQGILTRLDPKTQKVVKTFQVAAPANLFGAFDVLPNGHVVVPEFQQGRVVEYDADGKQVATLTVPLPNSAVRLPNGNTLVATQNARRLIEFDRTGREVWSHTPEGMTFSARRR